MHINTYKYNTHTDKQTFILNATTIQYDTIRSINVHSKADEIASLF